MRRSMNRIGKNDRVAVLCGGLSSEREVSLVSGKAVAEAVAALDLPLDFFELSENRLPQSLDPDRHLVLPVIHGGYGEDGSLSADLDAGGFFYGGCQQASSALCFDKLRTKQVASGLGISVAKDVPLLPGRPIPFASIRDALGVPFILKPLCDGSSVGLYLIESEEAYSTALETMRDRAYLAEAYEEGFDLTVGVLEGKALGVIGVHPEGSLFDYAHKYTEGLSRYDVPAKIDPDLREALRGWSVELFTACGCRDLARIDFHQGLNGTLKFLEVNTIPGMTPTSLLPKSAACFDYSFEDLIFRWIELIAARKEKEGGQ